MENKTFLGQYLDALTKINHKIESIEQTLIILNRIKAPESEIDRLKAELVILEQQFKEMSELK